MPAPLWTLQTMQTMFRQVSGNPSGDQISDDDITTLLNDYYVMVMPFELKEQIQLTFYDFKVFPGVSTYPFSGAFLTDQPGAYVDGNPLIFYQDPDIFYQDFPQQYTAENVATGDGTTNFFQFGLQNPPIIIGSTYVTDGVQVLSDNVSQNASQTIAIGSGVANYTGTLFAFPIVAGSLFITNGVEKFADNGSGLLTGNLGGTGTINYATGAWDVTFASVVLVGVAIVATYLLPTGIGVLTGNGMGSINYATGAVSILFTNPPPSSATIYSKYQGYQANRPQGVLFFNNQFTFMPIPDQVYQIRMQGYIQPSFFVLLSDQPTLQEWGPLIVYGAALDRFSRIGDIDAYNRYYPILKRYENVALARTVQQFQAEQSVERF